MSEQGAGYRTKTEVAVNSIRELLASGELSPGDHVTYRQLTERLQMSQTPVREAIRRLEAEGLLRSEPHKGVSVTDLEDLTVEEAQDLYLVRMILEREAARLAASKITDEQRDSLTAARHTMEAAGEELSDPAGLRRAHAQWHFQVHKASGSPYLATLCASAWNRFPWEAVWVIPGRFERSMEQHRSIEAAILAGDAERAATEMEVHVETGQWAVLNHLKQPPARPRKSF